MTERDPGPWSQELSRLLQRGAAEVEAPPEILERVLGRLDASLDAAEATPPPVDEPTPRLGVPPTHGAGNLLRLALAFGLGGASGALLYRELASPVVERVEVQVPIFVPAPTSTITAPAPSAHTPVAPAERPRSRAVVPESTDDRALARERTMLDEARSALARRDPNSALEATAAHAREHPRGRLAEERRALEVQALFGARRHDDARAAAVRFLDRYPTSIYRPVVEAVLKRLGP